MVDELRAPDGSVPGLLRQRMNFGVNWSDKLYGFGLDGRYFHSRILPQDEWEAQGSDQVDPYWQFDGFVQADLGHWLPWTSSHYSVRGQLRVNNLFDSGPPKFARGSVGCRRAILRRLAGKGVFRFADRHILNLGRGDSGFSSAACHMGWRYRNAETIESNDASLNHAYHAIAERLVRNAGNRKKGTSWPRYPFLL